MCICIHIYVYKYIYICVCACLNNFSNLTLAYACLQSQFPCTIRFPKRINSKGSCLKKTDTCSVSFLCSYVTPAKNLAVGAAKLCGRGVTA